MKMKINVNTLIGSTAVIVSLGTLIVLIYQSKIMREHEEKSAVPKLELWNDLSGGYYALSVINRGLGPAIIEKVTISYNEKEYNLDPMQFIYWYADSTKIEQPLIEGSSLYPGIIIPNEHKVVLTRSTDSLSTSITKDLFYVGIKKKAKVIIYYSSIYGKVWKLDGTGDLPNVQFDYEPSVFNELFND
jgi:hypothetical protein